MTDDKKPEDEAVADATDPAPETEAAAEAEAPEAEPVEPEASEAPSEEAAAAEAETPDAAAEDDPTTSEPPEAETASATASAEPEPTPAAKSSGADLTRVALVVLLSILLFLEVKYGIMIGVLVTLITYLAMGEPPEQVRNFLKSLAKVVVSTVAFVLMQTEERPWPLAPWPKPNDD